MANKRNAIFELIYQGKRMCEIARLLQVRHATISKTIKRFNALDHEEDRPITGRKRTVKPLGETDN